MQFGPVIWSLSGIWFFFFNESGKTLRVSYVLTTQATNCKGEKTFIGSNPLEVNGQLLSCSGGTLSLTLGSLRQSWASTICKIVNLPLGNKFEVAGIGKNVTRWPWLPFSTRNHVGELLPLVVNLTFLENLDFSFVYEALTSLGSQGWNQWGVYFTAVGSQNTSNPSTKVDLATSPWTLSIRPGQVERSKPKPHEHPPGLNPWISAAFFSKWGMAIITSTGY